MFRFLSFFILLSCTTFSKAEEKTILFWNYDTSKTVKIVYDTQKGKIIKSEELEAYPCPVSEDEKKDAIELAKTCEKIKLFLKEYPNYSEITYKTPVISDPKNKLYGKRLVLVQYWVTVKVDGVIGKVSSSVEVNLTDKNLND